MLSHTKYPEHGARSIEDLRSETEVFFSRFYLVLRGRIWSCAIVVLLRKPPESTGREACRCRLATSVLCQSVVAAERAATPMQRRASHFATRGRQTALEGRRCSRAPSQRMRSRGNGIDRCACRSCGLTIVFCGHLQSLISRRPPIPVPRPFLLHHSWARFSAGRHRASLANEEELRCESYVRRGRAREISRWDEDDVPWAQRGNRGCG